MEEFNLAKYRKFEHIEKDLNKWPISLFANTRKSFLIKLHKDVYNYFSSLPKEDLDQAIARAILRKATGKIKPMEGGSSK